MRYATHTYTVTSKDEMMCITFHRKVIEKVSSLFKVKHTLMNQNTLCNWLIVEGSHKNNKKNWFRNPPSTARATASSGQAAGDIPSGTAIRGGL